MISVQRSAFRVSESRRVLTPVVNSRVVNTFKAHCGLHSQIGFLVFLARSGAALMASNAAAKTESLGMISSSGDAELRRSCWRLRWCAFCLLVATAMQASTVGSSLHLLYSLDEGDDGRLTLQLLSASIVLLLLLIAFWSLLSQLLLWSDVRVRDGRKGDLV